MTRTIHFPFRVKSLGKLEGIQLVLAEEGYLGITLRVDANFCKNLWIGFCIHIQMQIYIVGT